MRFFSFFITVLLLVAVNATTGQLLKAQEPLPSPTLPANVSYEGVKEYTLADFDSDVDLIYTFFGNNIIETTHKVHNRNKSSTEQPTINSKNSKAFLV